MSVTDALPALLGGQPARPQGPPGWPLADDDVLAALQQAYQNGSWGKYEGEYGPRLQQALAAYHGVEFALLCGSGTFAVELALRALRIGPGDEVILAGYDYPGNFLSVHAVGAHPVLVDVDPDNWNLSPELLAGAVGPQARALIASHLHGGIVPMRAVMSLAAERQLAVIEDAAQMPGALVQEKKAGTWGDVGILSFGGSKLLSAGRGGCLLTNRADVAQRARTWQLRGNVVCPMSELQAAVLLPQLDKLDARNAQRSRAVRWLREQLAGVAGLASFTNHVEESAPGYYKLGFQYDPASFGLSRERFLTAVRAEGIACAEGFRGLQVGRSPKRYRQVGELREAEQADQGVVVLHHPVLLGDETDLGDIVHAVRKVWTYRERLAEVLPAS
jgi:perosamine synthetase